jgi:hypothetical protein
VTRARALCACPQDGRDGIEAEWEKSDEFHEKWKVKARDVLARSEWRKRKLNKRVSGASGPSSTRC